MILIKYLNCMLIFYSDVRTIFSTLIVNNNTPRYKFLLFIDFFVLYNL